MEQGVLRTGKPDEFLSAAIGGANESVRSLGHKLFGFGEVRYSDQTRAMLREAAVATEAEVAALVNTVAPSLGGPVALAWRRLEKLPIAFPGWTIGEPTAAETRSIWLRDLLRELARFELPPIRDDALLWLAIHSGSYAEEPDSEFAAMMAKLLDGASYRLGTTGCDHVGRLLASEIAQGTAVSNDLLDTLRLVGTCRHPALPSEKRDAPSPHVARGLAGCGREDAIEALCETITVDRSSPELAGSAIVQAAAAAAEVFAVFPDVLPSVLETIAGELGNGMLDRESLGKQLAPVLALPAPLLAEPASDSVLRSCASALHDADRRQQMTASNDDSDLFLGFWAEAAIDIERSGHELLRRYEQASADGREDTKLLLRTFARLREGQSLAMRPLWLRMLTEALGDSPDQLNVAMVAEALNFQSASGVTSGNDDIAPADEALAMLVEIGSRLREPTLKAELVRTSSFASADQIDRAMAGLLVANLAGRPADPLLPFVSWLDYDGFALLADADFSESDVRVRAAVFERADSKHTNGPEIMARAVAAASSVDELANWSLDRFHIHSIKPLFALACALRKDRTELWRQLLLASKKDRRKVGLQLVLTTLKVIDATQKPNESNVISALPSELVVDSDAIRRDASQVLDEYEAIQRAKKRGDDLKSYLFLAASELARTSEEVETEASKKRAALARLCDRVAEVTGIERSRFNPTPPQPPRDRGSRFSDILGDVAPRLIESAAKLLDGLAAESLDEDERKARFNEWFDNRGGDLREEDGSERMRAHHWFVGPGNWQFFDEKVLGRATPLMSDAQSRRMAELRPPVLRVSARETLQRFFESLKSEVKCNQLERLLAELDWYESVLANLPESIQRLGPVAEHSAAPHPPHEQGIAYVYMIATDLLRWGREDDQSQKERVRQRLWPLNWWAASFGGRVESINAAAIASAVSSGQASLGDLVWYLVQPDYSQFAGNLVSAVEHPDQICLRLNPDRDFELRAVVDAVAGICREQEMVADPLLPPTLASTWRKMPAPKGQSGLPAILAKYAQVAYQSVGRTDDQQKAFASRIRESLSEAAKSWTVKEDFLAPRIVSFDKLDAWIKNTTSDLRKLIEKRTVSEETLIRVALDRPLLMRSVLEATGRGDQLEAGVWLAFHTGSNLEELAITLDASTGHGAIRRPSLSTQQIEQRLLDHYAPEIGKRNEQLFYRPIEDATIRHSWKRAAIDTHPREKVELMLKALKAVVSPTNRLRVEGLLDAMDGKLSGPAKRKQLEASIKDRPNLALLQLAVMPLPDGHEELVTEISRRLMTFEALSVEGRKRKSAEARESMRRALDQARRTLADNAGLADPTQLDWLSGEAIAKELAEFERLEVGETILQLRLRGDGPHVLVTKSGKSLKSIPAAFKSSESGKRLTELQKRLKTSLRDTRTVLEAAMVRQRPFLPDDLKMMMKHPVVAAIGSELIFIVESGNSDGTATIGLPSEAGDELVGLDGKGIAVSGPARIAHPLTLDGLGVLTAWQTLMTEHPPQPFQQVDRAFVRAADVETANEGKRVVRHDGVALNEDQAFRILQAHGWADNRDVHELCRTFPSDHDGEVTATLTEFMWHSSSIGSLEFRDSSWNEMPITEVPPIILSEAIRDIDRTVAGSSG